MFSYCTEVLNLSEPEAYLRIAVGRAARRFPAILTMLAEGRLHLSGIALLAPHLTGENCERVLTRAAGKSKRQIEELIAELAPKPDVPATIRKLPAPPPRPSAELRPDKVEISEDPKSLPPTLPVRPAPPIAPRPEPLSPQRFKVTFTASQELKDKLERLQALTGEDLESVLDAAVTEKLDRLQARRYAQTKSARKSLAESDTAPKSRYIPAAVKRAVYHRDQNRCTFVDKSTGRQCSERHLLEFHHHDPFGRGGDHNPDHVSLRCRLHNLYQAERDYGTGLMEKYRRGVNRVSEGMLHYGGAASESPRPLSPTRPA
jgi:hypothetical protein